MWGFAYLHEHIKVRICLVAEEVGMKLCGVLVAP